MKTNRKIEQAEIKTTTTEIETDLLSCEEVPVALIRINSQEIITFSNTLADKLLGVRKGKLVGRPFLKYIRSDDVMTYRIARQNAIFSSANQVCEVYLFGVGNQLIYCRIDISNNGYSLVLTDYSYKKKVDDTQAFLLGGKWSQNGQDFFYSLAEYLGNILEADYVCIDRLHGNLQAETVAVFNEGRFEDNIRYSLLDTPCGKVLGTNLCCFPQSVRFLFPNDEFLQKMGAEGYVGVTLKSSVGKPIGLIAVISKKPVANIMISEMILKQVSIRAAAEMEYRIAERKFSALRKSNHAMFNSLNEKEIMANVCSILTQDCGYAMMWIGLVNHDKNKTITPIVSAGFEDGYLEKVNLTWADTERGRGPTGTCVRTGKPCISNDIINDPNFAPWREDAIRRGYASSIALPLINQSQVFGAIAIYAGEPFFFKEEEINILIQMSNNLSHGITSLRLKSELERVILEKNKANDIIKDDK